MATGNNKAEPPQPAYSQRFVIKKHKPEVPEEQHRMVKSLQHDVIRSVNAILLTIRSRQPRTEMGWDHGGPHDLEIQAIREQISNNISQVFEAVTTPQHDRIVYLEGLHKEATSQVSKLEKILADKDLSCQAQTVTFAQGCTSPARGFSATAPSRVGSSTTTGSNSDREQNKVEPKPMDRVTIAVVEAVFEGQKRVEDMVKQLDQARKEFELASRELRAAQTASGGGSGRGGGSSRTEVKGMDVIEEGAVEGQGVQNTTNEAEDSKTAAEASLKTPRKDGHPDTPSGDCQTLHPIIRVKASSSSKNRRQLIRRHTVADSDDWKALAVGYSRHISPSSSKGLFQKFRDMGLGGGGAQTAGAPVAEGTRFRSSFMESADSPPVPIPRKSN